MKRAEFFQDHCLYVKLSTATGLREVNKYTNVFPQASLQLASYINEVGGGLIKTAGLSILPKDTSTCRTGEPGITLQPESQPPHMYLQYIQVNNNRELLK